MEWTTVRISKELKKRIEEQGNGGTLYEKLKSIVDRDKTWIESKIDERVEEKIKEIEESRY